MARRYEHGDGYGRTVDVGSGRRPFLRAQLEPAIDTIQNRLCDATVILEATLADKVIGEGSAFFVAVPPPNGAASEYDPDILVVTAKHNVQGAQQRNARINLLIPSAASGSVQRLAIPYNAWAHSAVHDVSIAPLPAESIQQPSDALAVPISAMASRFAMTVKTPIHSYVFGRGRVANSNPIIIRTINVQQEQVHVNLQGCERGRVPVLIGEGVVTPGMSGGPITASTGIEDIQRTIIGLAHGYDKSFHVPEPAYDIRSDEIKHLRIELLREIWSVRQQFVYIVPSRFIIDTIRDTILSWYPRRPADNWTVI
jgi:hypothetical protein